MLIVCSVGREFVLKRKMRKNARAMMRRGAARSTRGLCAVMLKAIPIYICGNVRLTLAFRSVRSARRCISWAIVKKERRHVERGIMKRQRYLRRLRSLLKKHGRVLLPLPSSPDVNPIKEAFAGMKKKRERPSLKLRLMSS